MKCLAPKKYQVIAGKPKVICTTCGKSWPAIETGVCPQEEREKLLKKAG